MRWTKDADGDGLGGLIVLHEETLDRTTNCTGRVADRTWAYTSAHCRTDVGQQPLLLLKDLLAYAGTTARPLSLEIKVASISDADARQFWS